MWSDPVTTPNARADDESRMALLVSHQRPLFQYILSLLPNVQEAEDVLQEANVVLWRKSSHYRAGTSYFAWAARVAQLEVLKHRRKMAASRKIVVLDDEVVDQLAAEGARDTEHREAVRVALQDCIGKLRPQDRELIVRRYAPGASGKRLAEDLLRPQNSVYKSLGRIRQALLECIDRFVARSLANGGVG